MHLSPSLPVATCLYALNEIANLVSCQLSAIFNIGHLLLYLQESILHRQLQILSCGQNKELDPDGCETTAREAFPRSGGLYYFFVANNLLLSNCVSYR